MSNFRRPSLLTKIKHGRKLNTGENLTLLLASVRGLEVTRRASQTVLTRELLIIIHSSNYSTWKYFHVFNFSRLGVSMKKFLRQKFPDLRYYIPMTRIVS